MITRIVTKDLRGHSLDVELEKFTVIGGPHGSGKTSLVMAPHLALLGYYPGDDKTGAAIMSNCSGDELGAAVQIDGHSIGRRWNRSGDGKVSATAKVDKEKASGKTADGMIRMALGGSSRIFDGLAFWGFSDRETRKAILRLTAGEKADELLDLDAKPREALNSARAARQAAEKALANAAASLSELPSVAGDLGILTSKVDADRKTLNDLRTRIAAGDQADEERTRLLRLIEGKPAAEAERDRLRAQVKSNAREKPKDYATQGIVEAVQYALDALKKDPAVAFLDPVNKAVERLAWTLAECEAAKSWPEQEKARDALQKAIGVMEQKVRDANAATVRIKSLPECPTKEDRTAAQGLETRLAATTEQINAATRRAQVARMVEQSRAQVEKCAEQEQSAKVKLADAATEMSAAIEGAIDTLKTRAGKILLTGALNVLNTADACRLGWHRDGVGYVARQSLSGSERVIFDAAVAYALLGDGCTAFLDAGEVSNDALAMLAGISESCPCQVILCRWTDSKVRLPKMQGWKVIEL